MASDMHLRGRKNKSKQQVAEDKMVHPEVPHVPEFLSRVANIPFVHTAYEYASDAYGKAKDSSPPLIKKTLSTAEGTVNYAAKCVLPVVQTLEKPINVVDILACKTLDKVEETLPVVTKTTGEIVATTRSYVNGKLQSVQKGVSSAANIVSGATDKLLNNRFGCLTLNSVEYTVTTVHECIDYLIPPISGDSVVESPQIPAQPSGKIMWTVRQSFDAVTKVQHRLTAHVQRVLHDQTMNALAAIDRLVDLLGWMILNWREIMTLKMLPKKLHQVAVYYRNSVEGDRKGSEAKIIDDVIFLAGYFTNRCVECIRGAISTVTGITECQSIITIRLQLSLALAITLDFATRVLQTLTSDNLMKKIGHFLHNDFPVVHNALMTAKNVAVNPPKDKAQ